MEPEPNRNERPSENYSNVNSERYRRSFPSTAYVNNQPSPYNYMPSPFHSMYNPYPYQNYYYGNNSYPPESYPSWRQGGGYPHYPASMGNYSFPQGSAQSARANHAEMKEKRVPEIINLESDESEEHANDNVQLSKAVEKKQIQKPPVVIEIEDNTPQERIVPNSIEPLKMKLPSLNQEERKNLGKGVKTIQIKDKVKDQTKEKQKIKDKITQKSRENREKEKQKQKQKQKQKEKEREKDKQKEKEKEKKIHNKQQIKGNKVNGEDRRETLALKRPLTSLQIQQKIQQKKQKEEKRKEREKKKIETKIDKHQAERKKPIKSNDFEYFIPKAKKQKKEKKDELEIAKYLQSHGEIRQGRQFQAQIPSLISNFASQYGYRCWVQEKRKIILSHQMSMYSI